MLKSNYLALMMLLGAGAGAADAATMKATYSGTIYSGYDQTGVFGDADSDLSGEAFTISFIYDTSKGIRTTDASQDYVYGGSGYGVESPVTSASVEIKGSTYSFPAFYVGYAYESSPTAEAGLDLIYHYAYDYSSDAAGYRYDYAYFYEYLSGLLAGAGLDEPKEIDLTGDAGYCSSGEDYTYNCFFGIESYDYATGYSQYAYGYLAPDQLSITEVAPVPLPASALLLGAAFGAIGALRLRRRAA